MYKYIIASIFITCSIASASDKVTDTKVTDTIDVKVYTTKKENVNLADVDNVTKLELNHLSTECVDKDITPQDFYKKMAERPKEPLRGCLYLIIKKNWSTLLTYKLKGNLDQLLMGTRDELVREIIFVTPNNVYDVDTDLAKKIAATRSQPYLEQVAKNMGDTNCSDINRIGRNYPNSSDSDDDIYNP